MKILKYNSVKLAFLVQIVYSIFVVLASYVLSYIVEDNGRNLSGGQRQRIAIARNKNIFVSDEACANLDVETSNFIEKLILEKNATVIFITHHLDAEIEKLVDEKIILK